jgi:hypothetical protein
MHVKTLLHYYYIGRAISDPLTPHHSQLVELAAAVARVAIVSLDTRARPLSSQAHRAKALTAAAFHPVLQLKNPLEDTIQTPAHDRDGHDQRRVAVCNPAPVAACE